MKLHIPLALLAALVSFYSPTVLATTVPAPSTSLGNLMYIGDSITHGINSSTHRWELHKIFADNGISYDACGINTGNSQGKDEISTGTVYGGSAFENVHSAQSSGRAWEISGEAAGSRYGGSNIKNWLGLSEQMANGETYTGETFTGDKAPDTYVMMIGTNDLLSDQGDAAYEGSTTEGAKQIEELMTSVKSILASIQEATPDATLILTTIPCWSDVQANVNAAETHQVVADYNTQLIAWGETAGVNVKVVDINQGLIDVTSGVSMTGVTSLFNPPNDAVHPSTQGSRIIAANIAKAYGLAGRTAGQLRMGAKQLAVNFYAGTDAVNFSADALKTHGFTTQNVTIASASLGMSQGSTLSYNWAADNNLNKGYTLDFGLTLGDGATGGWSSTDELSITLGNGTTASDLNITESYIKWGDTILYSIDMSSNIDDLRLSYIVGDASNGLESGYYLWLDDMLIGEALDGIVSTVDGLLMEYNGTGDLTLTELAVDGTQSYAPTTDGLTNADGGFIAEQPQPVVRGLGSIDWVDSTNFTATSALTVLNNNLRVSTGFEGGVGTSLDIITTGLSIAGNKIYANSGDYTGDIRLDIQGGVIADTGGGWYAAHTGGTLTGNVVMRFSDEAKGGNTKVSVFGVLNNLVKGNVYLEFSAAGLALQSFTGANASSVMAVYDGTIEGDFTAVFNAGSFANYIAGGAYLAAGKVDGSASIYINGGNFAANIYGGNISGSITGNSSVSVTGGTIADSIYGGNYGGSLTGNSSVTILGTTAKFTGANAVIAAGSQAGTQGGSATLTLKDIADNENTQSIDKFTGTLSGGQAAGEKSLIFDNVTLTAALAAKIVNFDKISLINTSSLTLSSLGGAKSLSIAAGSSLSLTKTIVMAATPTAVDGASGLSFLTDVVFDVSALDVDLAGGTFQLFNLTGGQLLGASFTSLNLENLTGITGLNLLESVTFHADGSVTFTTATETLAYTGGVDLASTKTLTWNTTSASFDGTTTFADGNAVNFTGYTNAVLAENINSSIVSLADSAFLKVEAAEGTTNVLTASVVILGENAQLHILGNALDLTGEINGVATSNLIIDRGADLTYNWTEYSTALAGFAGTVTIASGQLDLAGDTATYAAINHFIVEAGATLHFGASDAQDLNKDITLSGTLRLSGSAEPGAGTTITIVGDAARIEALTNGNVTLAAITGIGTLTAEGNGFLAGAIDLDGDLIVEASSVDGNHALLIGFGWNTTNALEMNNLIIQNGARVYIQHATRAESTTNVVLEGGSMIKAAASNGDAGIAWNGLIVKGNAEIELLAQGGFVFENLTNTVQDSILTVTPTNKVDAYTKLELKSITNYDGTLTMAQRPNAALILRGTVSQEAGQEITITGGIRTDVYDLSFTGAGSMIVENALQIDGAMTSTGASLTLNTVTFVDNESSLNIYGGVANLNALMYQAGTVEAPLTSLMRFGNATIKTTGTTIAMGVELGGFDSSATAGTLADPIMTTIDTAGGDFSISGSIADLEGSVGGLIVQGAGVVTLTGDNSFQGGVVLKSGTLVAASATALGAGAVSQEAGTLNLSDKASTNAINALSGSITNYSAYSGTITKTGEGALDFALAEGTSNSTAHLVVNGGSAKLAANSAAGSFSSISVASGATLDLSAGSVGIGGSLTLGAGAKLAFGTESVAMGANGSLTLVAGAKFNIDITGLTGTSIEKVLFTGGDLADFESLGLGAIGKYTGILASELLGSLTFNGEESGLLADGLYIIYNEAGELVLTNQITLASDLVWVGGDGTWTTDQWLLEGGGSAQFTENSAVSFNFGGGLLTVGSDVIASNMTVSSDEGIYYFGGSKISLTGNLTVTEGATAIFDNKIEIAGSLLVDGSVTFNEADPIDIKNVTGSGSLVSTGNMIISGTAANSIGDLSVTAGSLTVTSSLSSTGNVSAKGDVSITGVTNITGMLTSANGSITLGAGANQVGSMAAATGSITVEGSLSSTLDVGADGDVSITGVTDIAGMLTSANGSITLGAGANEVGSMSANSSITVTGSLTSTVATGAVSANGDVSITGVAKIAGALTSTTGSITLGAGDNEVGSLDAGSALSVTGSLSSNKGAISAGTSINITGNLIAAGDVSANGSITVSGTVGEIGDVSVATAGDISLGAITIAGAITTASGNISLTGDTAYAGIGDITATTGAITATNGTLTTIGSITTTGDVSATKGVILGGVMNVGGTLSTTNIMLRSSLIIDNKTLAPVISAVAIAGSSLTIDVESPDVLLNLSFESNKSILISLKEAYAGTLGFGSGSGDDLIVVGDTSYEIMASGSDIIIARRFAGDYWSPVAGSTDWSSDDNWANGVPIDTSAVVFAGGGNNTVTLDTDAVAGSVNVVGDNADTIFEFVAAEGLDTKLSVNQFTVSGGTANVGVDLNVTSSGDYTGSIDVTADGNLVLTDGATVTAEGMNVAGELELQAGSTMLISGDTKALNGSINNAGDLSLAGSSVIGALTSTGVLKLAKDATLEISGDSRIDSLVNNGSATLAGELLVDATEGFSMSGDGQLSVGSITDGAKINLIDAGSTLNVAGNVILSSYSGEGAINVDGVLTLTSKNANAGSITATSLVIDTPDAASAAFATMPLTNADSSFGDLNVDTLTLADAMTKDGYMLSADSLASVDGTGSTSLRLTQVSTWANDPYYAIDGKYLLIETTQANVQLHGDTVNAINELVYAGKDVFFRTDGGSVELEIVAATERRWNTSDNFAVTPGCEDNSDLHITPIYNLEGTEIIKGFGEVKVVSVASVDIFDTVEQVFVDESLVIDLTKTVTSADNSVVLNNLVGAKGEIFELRGDGVDSDFVTINANKVDSAATGQFEFRVKELNLIVTSENGAEQTFDDMQLVDAKLDVTSDAILNVGDLYLTNGNVIVADGGELNVGSISNGKEQLDGADAVEDTISTISGHINITGSGSNYTGGYIDATIATTNSSAFIKLVSSAELSLAGTAGQIYLTKTDDGFLNKIETTGANVAIELGEEALTLNNDSSMVGGELGVILGEKTLGNTLIEGNLTLTDTVIKIMATGGMVLTDPSAPLFVLGDGVVINGEPIIEFDSFFSKYYSSATVDENGVVSGVRNTSYYDGIASSHNGRAGASLLSEALLNYNPQADGRFKDLKAVMDSMDIYMAMGSQGSADKLAAAVAGASVTALGSAQMSDMERQLGSIRNRTMSMGLNPYDTNEEQPAGKAWISAEGGSSKLDDEGTASGHDLSTFGGSVGVDFDVHENFSFGAAITAMYGSIDSNAADVGDGTLNTQYVTFFARSNVKRWTHSFIASFGSSDADMDRTVNYFGGKYETKGSTDGFSAGLMYELGYTIPLDEEMNTCWQPVFNISFVKSSLDGYTERGSDAGLKVGDQDSSYVTLGLGGRIETVVGTSVYNRASILSARAMFKADMGDRSSEADVSFANAAGSSVTVKGAEAGAVGAEFGIGLTIPVTFDTGAIFMDASVDLRDGMTSGSGSVGYRFAF